MVFVRHSASHTEVLTVPRCARTGYRTLINGLPMAIRSANTSTDTTTPTAEWVQNPIRGRRIGHQAIHAKAMAIEGASAPKSGELPKPVVRSISAIDAITPTKTKGPATQTEKERAITSHLTWTSE